MGVEGSSTGEETQLQQDVEKSIDQLGPEVKALDEKIQAKQEELKAKLAEESDSYLHPRYHSAGPEWEMEIQASAASSHLSEEADRIREELKEMTTQYIQVVNDKIHELGMDK